jgi:hypothetical protein
MTTRVEVGIVLIGLGSIGLAIAVLKDVRDHVRASRKYALAAGRWVRKAKMWEHQAKLAQAASDQVGEEANGYMQAGKEWWDKALTQMELADERHAAAYKMRGEVTLALGLLSRALNGDRKAVEQVMEISDQLKRAIKDEVKPS